MEKLYINGKTFIPENDILLCDVREQDPLLSGYAAAAMYVQIYTTHKGAFYKIGRTAHRKEAQEITKEEATAFMNENAAYIITENYAAVFGEPERG